MGIIEQEELPRIRAERPYASIVFCSGSFDLLHLGHVEFLTACKSFGDCLVVAVGNDTVIKRIKGDGRPIMNEDFRLRMVVSQRAVDYCYLDRISRSKDDLTAMLEYAFENLKPSVYAVCNDAFDPGVRLSVCERFGIEVAVVDKAALNVTSVSTTKIIETIRKKETT